VAVDRINGVPTAPAFVLHTGDISHLSKPSEFDTVDQVLKSAKASHVFYDPPKRALRSGHENLANATCDPVL
jgi:hypothetical protein